MSTIARARLKIRLELDNRITTVEEGDVLRGVHYMADGVEQVVDGRIRVIVAATTANNAIPDDCPPEPYVWNYIRPTALLLDSSDVHDADIIEIPIADLISVEHVSTEETLEQEIDAAFQAEIPGATVTEELNNTYNIITSTGEITSGQLFDLISSMVGYESIEITCPGYDPIVHHTGDDMTLFKQQVDAITPKSYRDPSVTLTMIVSFL